MLEWKPQAFPNTSWMNQPNISHDSHCFSSALAACCYPTGHICLVPLIGACELLYMRCRVLHCCKIIFGDYQLITFMVNRSWETILEGKWQSNSIKSLWGKKTVCYSFFSLIYFEWIRKTMAARMEENWLLFIQPKMIKNDYSLKMEKNHRGHREDIWSCIIPTYWKLGSSVMMRIFSGVFILGTKLPNSSYQK